MKLPPRLMKQRRGQVGVGTLIVFIAMILVAAIAAAVLVRTAGNLQSKALATGDRSKSQVSTSVETVLLTATDGTNQNIEDFKHIMRLVPGSEGVILNAATLRVDTATWSADLTYATGNCTYDSSEHTNGTLGYWTNSTGGGFYTVEYIEQGSKYVSGYFQRGDLLRMCYRSVASVSEDSDVTVSFLPAIGNIHVIDFATPNIMTQNTTRLYP